MTRVETCSNPKCIHHGREVPAEYGRCAFCCTPVRVKVEK